MTIQFHCERCSRHRPVEISPIEPSELSPFAWGNIKCDVCGFVIATVSAEMRGRLVFVTEEQAAGERGGARVTANVALIKTHVIRCAHCKRWIYRMPQWYNADIGHRHYCQHCFCTSINISDGRPIGPRSRYWQSLIDEFNEILPIWTDNEIEAEWFWSTVEVSK